MLVGVNCLCCCIALQVPSICARFLIKMVQHNINPYNEWSAMPQQLQHTCRIAAAGVLKTVPASKSSSASQAAARTATGSSGICSAAGGEGRSSGAINGCNSRRKAKIVKRRR